MFLNPAQFDANSTANPNVEMPPGTLPDEPVKVLQPLRRQCQRWVDDNLALLRGAVVQTVCALNDRAADNWRPLLRIAELAGGEWPEKARAAALALSCSNDDLEAVGQQLLGDICEYFSRNDARAVRSRDLVSHLRLFGSTLRFGGVLIWCPVLDQLDKPERRCLHGRRPDIH